MTVFLKQRLAISLVPPLNAKLIIYLFSGSALIPLWWIIGNEFREFDLTYIVFSNLIAIAAVAIELALVFVLMALTKKWDLRMQRGLILIIMAATITINLFSMGISTLDTRSRYSFIVSAVLAVALLIMSSGKKGQQFLLGFAFFIVFFSSVNGLFLSQKYDVHSGSQSLSQVRVDAVLNKNLYVIVFDALVSKNAYNKLYGQDDTPWSQYLTDSEFTVLENAEAAGPDTLSSFKTIFGWGSYSRSVQMTGLKNPVYKYFQQHGYKTAFLNSGGYFGSSRTSSLDYFYPMNSAGQTCSFAPKFFLFNACSNISYKVELTELLDSVGKHLKDRDSNVKWLTTVYIPYPEHSGLSGEYEFNNAEQASSWKSAFISRVNTALPVIDKVVGEILARDSNSVILVFGDHGSWNFRGIPDEGSANVSSDLIKLDKYGVTFAVYPKNTCSNILKGDYQIKNILKDIVNCGALN
jgi:hypothetical protein